MVSTPALSFSLDSGLIFTVSVTPPAPGNYAGSTAPIGTIAAGTITLNLYAGIPESGNADFFTYKNVMYTLIKSKGVYTAVQKSYTVYVANPAKTQQQLAVFNLEGVTYWVTDGTTAGTTPSAGINSGSMWAATSTSVTETQFGLVYGFTSQPTSVSLSSKNVFQFQTTDGQGNITLYDIFYSANFNAIQVDVPTAVPSFMQSFPFGTGSVPLTFETGGYNAFTSAVDETAVPIESFAASYKTPITSSDPGIDQLITVQGDFSLEFWHSTPVTEITGYHSFTYAASSNMPSVYFVDVDFQDSTDVFVQINGTVMTCATTNSVFSSGWRHFALTYTQPYAMMCAGNGFEVTDSTSNYNFDRDFSIAITFSVSAFTVSPAQSIQGLLYKGTGSAKAPPETSMSYRVSITQAGLVRLEITDGTGAVKSFDGPQIQIGKYYRVIITKSTNTLAGAPSAESSNPDPYAPPFDVSDYQTMANAGASLTTSGTSGNITISGISAGQQSTNTKLGQFLQNLQNPPTHSNSYSVGFSLQSVLEDGTYGQSTLVYITSPGEGDQPIQDSGLVVNSTGDAHLLIGAAYDDQGQAVPLGGSGVIGNIRNVYLFNKALNPAGIGPGLLDIAYASNNDLLQAGLIGYWKAAYDPNGVVSNLVNQSSVAASLNKNSAQLVPLSSDEFEGTNLYLNGYPMKRSNSSISKLTRAPCRRR